MDVYHHQLDKQKGGSGLGVDILSLSSVDPKKVETDEETADDDETGDNEDTDAQDAVADGADDGWYGTITEKEAEAETNTDTDTATKAYREKEYQERLASNAVNIDGDCQIHYQGPPILIPTNPANQFLTTPLMPLFGYRDAHAQAKSLGMGL
eukprot:664923_1